MPQIVGALLNCFTNVGDVAKVPNMMLTYFHTKKQPLPWKLVA